MLGPPGSPQGVKSVSQAQKDDRLKELERRLEELAHMLDTVKTQVCFAMSMTGRSMSSDVKKRNMEFSHFSAERRPAITRKVPGGM